jgi:hypothetical protein
VKEALPATARIGVNDTGAIAYFGERPTFDVVGLTSRDEGRYWVAGAGSRLEHYERLRAKDPGALPTHFVVYPEWFACDALLGQPLREATVLDSSILGGQSMRAFVADYSLLGSGEAPWSTNEPVVDAIDVADLESEADHRYELLGARDGEEIVGYGPCPSCADARAVVDGGRTARVHDRFVAHLGPGQALRGVARVEALAEARARIVVAGGPPAAFTVAPAGWTEITFDVPPQAVGDATVVELFVDDGALTVFHYWFTERGTARSDR